jgi:prolyl-tRNA synthetase
MVHGDDQGLVLPPKIAPFQVVIVPIYKGQEQKDMIHLKIKDIIDNLKKAGIRVKYDDSDHSRPGWKFAEYELKGVPVRLAIGQRDLENNVVEVARRDTKEKFSISLDDITESLTKLLEDIQNSLFQKAKKYRDDHIKMADTWTDFLSLLEGEGGFISAHWDGTSETENEIKEKTKATIRCIPINNPLEEGKCILTGKSSKQRVLFARAY